MNNLDIVQSELKYTFNDLSLLETALTHISYAKEYTCESYERLEYLGDAVLELVVSDFIYCNYNLMSGDSSKLRASLVSTANLSLVSRNLKLGTLVRKGRSLSVISKKIEADLFESVVGAIYLDGGYGEAKKVIDRLVIVDKNNTDYHLNNCDSFKTRLQEVLQAEARSFSYKVVKEEGLDHNKTFTVELLVGGVVVSTASATSKQLAEERAAEKYLQVLK